MVAVSQTTALLHRVTGAYRRVTGAPEWPLAAGAFLGLLAMTEVVVRGGDAAGLASPGRPMRQRIASTSIWGNCSSTRDR